MFCAATIIKPHASTTQNIHSIFYNKKYDFKKNVCLLSSNAIIIRAIYLLQHKHTQVV